MALGLEISLEIKPYQISESGGGVDGDSRDLSGCI